MEGEDTFSLFSMEPVTAEEWQIREVLKYVARMQKIFPDKMKELCCMHLAFILDFSEGRLEALLSDDPACVNKKKLTLTPLFKKKEKNSSSLFGAPLTDEGVALLSPLIAFLRDPDNMKKEGLFRKPGNGRKMKCLKEQLLSHGPQVSIDNELYSSHDVACVLKEFLRELPEPLLTVRHMEAHKQIRALGSHANSPEDKERYEQKKLSALQLLMHLLPRPTQRIVRHLLKLLYLVSQEPETKMTAATLGTIFAPIFFLDRKTAATDVCDIVAHTEQSVAFMIQHGLNVFEVPKGLSADIITFWKGLEQSEDDDICLEGKQDKPKIRKCLSGRTINTNVCYIDRQASQSEDVASTTQAELENLFAQIQSLPDTPHNLKLKKQLIKSTTTPTSSAKKHQRSKSIGASIKKRFPSLGRNKHKNVSILTNSASSTSSSERMGISMMSYKSNDKVAVVHCTTVDVHRAQPLVRKLDFRNFNHTTITPGMSDLLNSPACTQPRGQGRQSRPRMKRGHNEPSPNTPDCTPPKMECKAGGSLTVNKPVSPNENIPAQQPLQTEPALDKGKHIKDCTRKTAVLKPLDKNQCFTPPPQSTKSLIDPGCARYLVRKDNEGKPGTTSLAKAVSDSCLPLPLNSNNNNSNGEESHCAAKQKFSDTQVADGTPKQVTTEKEITYVPYNGGSRVIMIHTPEKRCKRRPVAQVQHSKRYNATPGTPIMPRTLLQLSQGNALETSL